MRKSKRGSLVLDAIEQTLATVSQLPRCDETTSLCEQCQRHERTIKGWTEVPPSPEEREELMKSVLALQVEVLKAYRGRTRD